MHIFFFSLKSTGRERILEMSCRNRSDHGSSLH